MGLILCCLAWGFFGYMLGWAVKDGQMMRICRDQQARGDYWFDRYMSLARDDWEPIYGDDDES